MTRRLTLVPPLAATGWAGRKAPSLSDEAKIEAIWHDNRARRDAAAAAYGEPETPREYYRGRPGSQAETIVLDCLKALQAIPEIDRLYADELMDLIAKMFLDTATDGKTEVRRAHALLRITRRSP